MRAGLDEVLNMFHVWHSDAALLRCDFSFDRFAGSFRVRVRNVVGNEIKFWSDDTFSELVLRLTPDLLFEYAEPRNVPEEAAQFACGLVVSLPSTDSISFLELIETHSP